MNSAFRGEWLASIRPGIRHPSVFHASRYSDIPQRQNNNHLHATQPAFSPFSIIPALFRSLGRQTPFPVIAVNRGILLIEQYPTVPMPGALICLTDPILW